MLFGIARTPIRYVTSFKDQPLRSFALLQESRQIITLMCKQKPYPVWFSCRRKSYPVEREHTGLKLMSGKRTLILSHPYKTLSLHPLNTETPSN